MWNDKETDIDLLGHNKISETIISIMNEQDLRPLTIGVYGQWGVGKSSVLSLIKSKLESDEDTLCLTFNGWLFQGYEDTRSALMETVVSELMRLQPNEMKVLQLGKSLLKRINWLKVAKVGGSLAMTALTGMSATALLGIPGFVENVKGFFSPKEDKFGDEKVNVKVAQESEESLLKEAEETVPGQIHAFREELKELIETSKVSRIVVLVDELDRCLPAAVIDILEAIRLFLFVEGTVFVLAADEQMIEYAVRRHYPDLPVTQAEYTKHYLEKLVQIPIRVPSLNQLQTKNYIRFLLLQYQLQANKTQFANIVEAFEGSKENPYDNYELSYGFISKQLNREDVEIQRTMVVSEQLGAILSKELRGNPRNIKRFLNTIFLRLRIATIYKIREKVKLDALAKLMLLERFHNKEWDIVVSEVTASVEGSSALVKQLEEGNKSVKKERGSGIRSRTEEDTAEELVEWGGLQPALTAIDLRPYFFVSREKAIGFTSSDDLPHALIPVFSVLASGASIAMAGKQSEMQALSQEQAIQIFQGLVKASRSISNWDNTPDPVKGMLSLVQQQPFLEEEFIKVLDAIPSKEVKVWMISNLGGFKTENGRKAKKAWLDRVIASPDALSNIKKLATQMQLK